MQRNLPYQKALNLLLLAGVLLYPAMEALFPLLPPMLGLLYVKWRRALLRRDYPVVAVAMLYAIVFESVWGLPLYGLWAVMVLHFTLFDPKIGHIIHSDWLLDLISVALFDGLYFLFLLFYRGLMHESLVDPGLTMLYYLLADMAGVLLF
ncbi:hypothetical protein [Hydrogenimonas sp.]